MTRSPPPGLKLMTFPPPPPTPTTHLSISEFLLFPSQLGRQGLLPLIDGSCLLTRPLHLLVQLLALRIKGSTESLPEQIHHNAHTTATAMTDKPLLDQSWPGSWSTSASLSLYLLCRALLTARNGRHMESSLQCSVQPATCMTICRATSPLTEVCYNFHMMPIT